MLNLLVYSEMYNRQTLPFIQPTATEWYREKRRVLVLLIQMHLGLAVPDTLSMKFIHGYCGIGLYKEPHRVGSESSLFCGNPSVKAISLFVSQDVAFVYINCAQSESVTIITTLIRGGFDEIPWTDRDDIGWLSPTYTAESSVGKFTHWSRCRGLQWVRKTSAQMGNRRSLILFSKCLNCKVLCEN